MTVEMGLDGRGWYFSGVGMTSSLQVTLLLAVSHHIIIIPYPLLLFYPVNRPLRVSQDTGAWMCCMLGVRRRQRTQQQQGKPATCHAET